MRLSAKLTTVVLAVAVAGFAMAGCQAASNKVDVNADTPEGAAKIMPVSHEGRYEEMGANGCYGCHGASTTANPMLTQAVSLPDDHYTTSSPTSMDDLDGTHNLCNTCHVVWSED